jgi:hypothetical protein
MENMVVFDPEKQGLKTKPLLILKTGTTGTRSYGIPKPT